MRVLTWNLWWRFGDWRARRRAVMAVLHEAGPDVLALQEVWDAPAEGSVAQIADQLGLHHAFAASPDPGPSQRRVSAAEGRGVSLGNAVLSRWPITARAVLALPELGGAGAGRVALHARVAHPQGPVPVFTTHLASPPQHSAVRCEQVRALARFVAAHARAGEHPPVVTGDLNAEPDSDEVRLLGGHSTAPVVPDLVLVDAWRYADPADPGATWSRANPHVAATGTPSARVDHVLVGLPGQPLDDGRGRVRAVRVVGDRPVQGVWPSDHAAVLVDLDERRATG